MNTNHFTSYFPKQFQLLKIKGKTAFGNIVGKEENAGNQHFLLFPQYFSKGQ